MPEAEEVAYIMLVATEQIMVQVMVIPKQTIKVQQPVHQVVVTIPSML